MCANTVSGSGSMKMSKTKLKKMTMRPTLAVLARTVVLVELTSPSSAVGLVLIWLVQKALATMTKTMYDRQQYLLQ